MKHTTTSTFEDCEQMTTETTDGFSRTLQLEKGCLDAQRVSVDLEGLCLFHTKENLRTICRVGVLKKYTCFAVYLSAHSPIRFNGYSITDSQLVTAPTGNIHIREGRGIEVLTFLDERENFLKEAHLLTGLDEELISELVLEKSLSTPLNPSFIQLCKKLFYAQHNQFELFDHSLFRKQLKQEFITQILQNLIPDHSASFMEHRSSSKELVAQTCDLITSTPNRILTLQDICTQMGVSGRTLQYAFKNIVGISPMKFSKLHRLQRAQKKLTRSCPDFNSVKQIALEIGFNDFGHFSADYKNHFGELPSETLNFTG